jgi:mannitol 2-dehydrogenase
MMYTSLTNQQGIYHLIERENGGKEQVKCIRSIVEVLYGYENPQDVFQKLISSDVKLITMTVTEAGYFFDPSTKKLDLTNSNIQHDLQSPSTPHTIYGYLAHAIFLRHEANLLPFTIQSCDNIQGNGDLLKSLLIEFCQILYPNLVNYIIDSITFPNSMVDRITPAASLNEIEYVKNNLQIFNDDIPVTAESYRQWVIEDNYCNERPPWDIVGIQIVQSVKPYEKIKVRLLNGGHVAIGYSGYLANYELVHEVSSDILFQKYLRYFFSQANKTLLPVPGIDIPTYQEILIQRFSNPAIEDQILRLCKDGSAKIPGFILATLQELLEQNLPSQCVSFVIASYMKFLAVTVTNATAGDETKKPFIDDPLADRLIELITLANGSAAIFLSDSILFGSVNQFPQLIESVQSSYDLITSVGVQEAMTQLINSLPPL